ncbi:MAG: stage V sporulation protein AC [Cellulosilyticaceae bacterium]
MKNVQTLKKSYTETIKKHSPKNDVLKNSLRAFWVGGTICVIGQVLTNMYLGMGLVKTDAGTWATITLILLSTILTALNVYDKIGNYAGAGSIIPITGFANSMVSAAMEFKKEGFVFGMGARIFAVAGPVIVFGTIASVIVGLIYYFL